MNTEPNIFRAECGSRQVLQMIANKWTALVVCSLGPGPLRYSELRRRIDGVSQKMLTQTLRHLERDGLVSRNIYPVVPPKVEYSLTSLGRTLFDPLKAICRWSEEHLSEMNAARARNSVTPGRKVS